MRAAKLYQRWLACDCLGDAADPPLLSPVLLTEVQTMPIRLMHAATICRVFPFS